MSREQDLIAAIKKAGLKQLLPEVEDLSRRQPDEITPAITEKGRIDIQPVTL